MKKNIEIELKLLINEQNLKKLLASDLIKNAVIEHSKKTMHLASSYYDTEDMDLKKHGIAYRVRDKGDGTYEATVKTAQKSSSGLSERLEVNMPLTEDKAVLDGFKALGLPFELTDFAPGGVIRLFTTNINRTVYLLRLQDTVVEMAIDKGSIVSGNNTDIIDEIELELLEGDKGVLLDLAAKIADIIPVFIEKRSKFARGLALLGISADTGADKFKISSSGNIRTELLAAAQLHGDRLLQLQSTFLQAGYAPENIKKLNKELLFLRAYTAFGREFSDSEKLQSCYLTINKWMMEINKLQQLLFLKQEWQDVSEKSSLIFENSALAKKLAEAELEAAENIKLWCAEGLLAQIVFHLQDCLYNTAWENEDYLQAEGTVRCVVQKWQENLAAAADDLKKEYLLNGQYILKSMQGKAFGKAAEKIRGQLKALAPAKSNDAFSLLKNIGSGSNSRVLNRDIGILTGWLLALRQ